MSSGKCKLKQQDTTTQLKWPKSRTLSTANAGEDVSNRNSFIAGGNAKGTATLEDSLLISYKTKHTLTI